MAKATPPSGGSFDLDRLRKLFQMMEKHGVTEVDLKSDSEKWHIQRGPRETAAPMPMAYAAAPPPQPMMPAAPVPVAAPAEAAAAAPTPPGVTIDSPTVGTFYAAPSPEDPEFVKVGSVVSPDTIVCIVEAMKVFNQIPAETSGKIVEILVKNGDPVEFGQPLYRVEPA